MRLRSTCVLRTTFNKSLVMDVNSSKVMTARSKQMWDRSCVDKLTKTTDSLTSHTFRRERKGLVMLQLLSCRRGTQLLNTGNKMLTSAKHVKYLCSITTDAIYEERGSDWSHHVSAVATI